MHDNLIESNKWLYCEVTCRRYAHTGFVSINTIIIMLAAWCCRTNYHESWNLACSCCMHLAHPAFFLSIFEHSSHIYIKSIKSTCAILINAQVMVTFKSGHDAKQLRSVLKIHLFYTIWFLPFDIIIFSNLLEQQHKLESHTMQHTTLRLVSVQNCLWLKNKQWNFNCLTLLGTQQVIQILYNDLVW